MSNLVIVALPKEDDYVNKISSEKVAHMTLLSLGETSMVKNLDKIISYVEHAASTSLERFGLEVDHRGELGPTQADVLFFSKDKWSGIDCVATYNSYLLKDNNIRTAYDSSEQFPEWVPHLTLGFPETPAHPDNRDYPGITYVQFDRVAVWFGNYEGIEFPLKKPGWGMEVAYSDIDKKAIEDVLSHVGIKGMKWGVRKAVDLGFGIDKAGPKPSSSGMKEVHVRDMRRKIKTSGGSGHSAHPDAVKARSIGQIGKKSGLKSLSNQELEAYSRRLNLEANVKRLNYANSSPPKKFVLSILGQTGKNQASTLANDVATTQVKKHLAGRLVKAGALAAA